MVGHWTSDILSIAEKGCSGAKVVIKGIIRGAVLLISEHSNFNLMDYCVLLKMVNVCM